MKLAELLLKVGSGANYDDGDVLCAFTDHRICCEHAQEICHVKHLPKGLRPADCLTKHLLETTYQYRFDRISRTEVVRTELATGIQETFGPEAIDVPLYLKWRIRYERHLIFGTEGNEFWYGGSTDYSQDKVNSVWDKIEEHSPHLRNDEEFRLWPMGRLDIRHHLAVRVVDFSEAEAAGLISPVIEMDDDGIPILGEDNQPKVISKRQYKVDWRNAVLSDVGVTESQVIDPDFPVGRDAVIRGRQLHQSKEQPAQSDRQKLQKKGVV